MISIRLKDYFNPPARLVNATSIGQIRRASEEQNGKIYSGNVYRDDTVVHLLKAYSIGKSEFDITCDQPKCYYCESQGEEKGKFDIEHYRPKDGLSRKDWGNIEEHNGYYWLGNEWSNLLLSCRGCNGGDAKGTRFPISSDVRRTHNQPVNDAFTLDRTNCIISSEFLTAESPVLINPEFDVPEDHLTFDESGQILGKTERGNQTIEILNLKRGSLHIARKAIIDGFLGEINKIIDYHEQGRMEISLLQDLFTDICHAIRNRKSINVAYTLWGRYINENFETIFLSKLPDQYKKILSLAYVKAKRA